MMLEENNGDGIMEGDFDALRGALEQEKARAEDNLANLKRAQADFINYRRRSEVEKTESVGLGKSLAYMSILPVLDDFGRALAAIPTQSAEEPWVQGMAMIEKKFRQILSREGIIQIKTVGERFDPSLHEAVLRCRGEEGIVVEELQSGYTFQGKVLRPAKVKVSCEDIED
jgi:molecular chaperone GrpE